MIAELALAATALLLHWKTRLKSLALLPPLLIAAAWTRLAGILLVLALALLSVEIVRQPEPLNNSRRV